MNFGPASASEKLPVTTAATANLYATSAVQSLVRLSPSTTVITRRGTRAGAGSARARRRRWGDHRAEHEGDRPVQADHRVGRRPPRAWWRSPARSRAGRSAGVAAQLAQVREERRRVEQRWQEDQQDDVRVELDLGRARHEADPEASEHQQDRIGERTSRASTANPATATRRPKRTSSDSTERSLGAWSSRDPARAAALCQPERVPARRVYRQSPPPAVLGDVTENWGDIAIGASAEGRATGRSEPGARSSGRAVTRSRFT